MKFQGKIFDWNDEKGFGFVKSNGGGDKAFVHIKSFISSARRPMNDDEISYHIIKDKNDRYRAINIELLLGNVSTISVAKSVFIDSASIASFLILLTLFTLNNFLPFIRLHLCIKKHYHLFRLCRRQIICTKKAPS